jgi:hypothetical protein
MSGMSSHDDRIVSAALSALAASHAGKQAPAQVEQVLLHAFREQQARRVASRRWWPVWIAAAALAGGLMLMALLLPRRHREIAHTPPPPPAERPVPVVTAPALGQQAVAAKAPARRPRRAVRSIRRPPVDSEFVALVPGQPLFPEDFSGIVRVALPVSELARLGFPAVEEPRARRVTADLLLGQDGMAKAVRFVRFR